MLKTVVLIIGSFLVSLPLRANDRRSECTKAIHDGYQQLYAFKSDESRERFIAAIALAKELDNTGLLAESLFGAGQAIWYKGNFNAAVDTVKLSIEYFKQTNNNGQLGAAFRILSNIYDDQGDYENAFKAISESLDQYIVYNDPQNIMLSYLQMGALYKSIGEYDAAMEYYRLAAANKPEQGSYPFREMNHRLGELYATKGNIDSARYYYGKALIGNLTSKIVRVLIGDTYLMENKYDIAFKYYDSLFHEASLSADINIVIASRIGLSKVYLQRKQYTEAEQMVKEALDLSAQRGARQKERDAYKLLSTIYERKGDAGKALLYEKLYSNIKDSVVSNKLKGQLFTFRQKAELAQVKSLRDEKRLAEQQRNILFYGVLGILVLGIFIFYNVSLRHKNEKLHLKQRAADLEMQALRAQMNPHFIFNCLSAINHFILNNEADRASDYLTQFSRLIRMVLVNAGKATISLEEEVSMLKLYLNMEQLRFKNAFDYFIYHDPGVRPAIITVPSFILQPFCENAIWHGLLHKEGKGKLNIHFKLEAGILICTIKDNGIGREKAAAINTRSADKIGSFGHKLSEERLSLFNGGNAGTSFTIDDLRDVDDAVIGTIVTLKIKSKIDD
ncbi:histidine kinase [Chitinophagaceae bacterium LWZ2-11]